MGINGLLTDVRWEWTGTEVTADLIAGTTVLPVLDPEAITEGENVWIAGAGPYEILGADVDAATLTVTPGLEFDIDSGTEVATDIGGQPGRAWVCEVVLADADVPIEVPLTVHDLAVMPEGNYDPPVVIVLSDDLEKVENLPGSLPTIDGIYIPPESLPEGPQGVPGPPGADGAPQYTWVKYADSPTTGMSDDPAGKAYMGLSYNHSSPTESSNYADYQWSKVMGDPGPPAGVIDLSATTQVLTQPAAGGATTPATAVVTGVGTNTTITTWEYSSDGAGFTGALPTGVTRAGNVVTITGATMVAKTITVRMTNGAGISDSLTVSRVSEGAGGAPGPQGPPGTGVSGTVVTYQVGSSGTVAPTGTWVATPPATSPGQFLWTRTVTTYTDSSTSTAYSVAAHGTTGNPGAPGPPGDDGAPGAPGRGIASTAVTYQVGSDGTSAPTGAWVASPPATSPGTFLWTRTVTTYTDASTSTAYSVAAHGATGSTGSPGNPGAPGVGVSGTAVTYQVGNSGTSAPTGSWVSSPPATTPGTFLWTRTITTYTDASTSTAYSVAAHGATGSTGSPGNPGAPGVGVSGTAVTYQAGSSGTSTPTGTWVASPPATSPGQFLWTRTVTTYTDSSTSTAYSVAAHGTTGNPGADAYTISQSNEAHTFPGSTTAALAGSTTTTFTALKGASAIPAAINNANITGAPTGMTTAVSGSPGSPVVTITVTTALVQQSGTLTIPVVVDGFTFNKIFSWSVSRQGTQGTAGPPGADGTPRYTWTKYADNATGTVGFSDVPTATSKYLGMAYNQLTLTESNNPGDYQWALIQGATGPTGPPGTATDGNPPPSSPAPEVMPGIGSYYLRWVPPANADPLTFEVHVSATAGFTPTSATLYSETGSYTMTVRNRTDIDPNTAKPYPFDYGVPYYFRIIAKDKDGAAAPGAEQSGTLTPITGADIAVNSIAGEHIVGNSITGDKFSGTLIMGSTITTGIVDDNGFVVGARVELGPSGLRVVDAAGQDVFTVPLTALESAKMRANFEMLSAQVLDNFTLYGLSNRIATGAALFLASGVAAPTATPSLAHVYDTLQLDTVTAIGPQNSTFGNLGVFRFDPAQVTSVAWNSTWSVYEIVQQKSGGFRIWRFDPTTGAIAKVPFSSPAKNWVDDFDDRVNTTNAFGNGAVAATQGGATLFQSGGIWYFWGPTEINRIPDSWILDIAARPPVLGFDAINDKWFIAQSDGGGAGTFHARRFNVVHYSGTGPFPNATSFNTYAGEAESGLAKKSNGAYYGTGGGTFAGNRFVWSTEDYTTFWVFGNAGALQNDEGTYECWAAPAAKQGFCFTGTEFHSLDATGKITKYTNWTWPQLSATSWIGLSAFDSDTAGVSTGTSAPHAGQTAGQHETPVGAIISYTAQRRAKLQITFPKTQDSGGVDDPDLWKAYWARTTIKPTTGSAMKFAGQAGSAVTTSSIILTSDPLGAAPPGGIGGQPGAVNNFPAGTASMLASQATDGLGELIKLKGDGSWRLGHLAGTASGTDANDTGWITPTLQSGWVNYGSPYAPAGYRRVGNRVFLRGLVQNGGFGSANPIFTLPVGFRPNGGVANMDLIVAGAVQNRAVVIPTTGDPDDNITATASAGTAHTHGMKQHHHPITDAAPTNMVSRVDVIASSGIVHCATSGGAWVSLSLISFFVD